jgi:glutamine phosphoribosylpyrophosphate amidotransferase
MKCSCNNSCSKVHSNSALCYILIFLFLLGVLALGGILVALVTRDEVHSKDLYKSTKVILNTVDKNSEDTLESLEYQAKRLNKLEASILKEIKNSSKVTASVVKDIKGNNWYYGKKQQEYHNMEMVYLKNIDSVVKKLWECHK